MLRMTREWVRKAENDYDVVSILLRSRKPSRYDATCFHAQQCAEKYFKARLTEAAIAFSKTHDLKLLLQELLPVEPAWIALWPDATELSPWSVQPRYPGHDPTAAQAKRAIKSLRKIRASVRLAFGLRV